MYQYGKRHTRPSLKYLTFIFRGLTLLFLLCFTYRVHDISTRSTAAAAVLRSFISSSSLSTAILRFEVGAPDLVATRLPLLSLLVDPTFLNKQTELQRGTYLPGAAPVNSSSPTTVPTANVIPSNNTVSSPSPNMITASTSVQPSPNVITKQALERKDSDISLYNKTNYSIDIASLLKDPLKLVLNKDTPSVLIIHTHGSEAYSPDDNNKYIASDPYRTEDKRYSVIRVGAALAESLRAQGIGVVHNTDIFDYPSYNGCYERSYTAIEAMLKKYPSIKIVLDVHRDAIEASDGSVYKTIAQVGSTKSAQLLLLVGTDASGLYHPNWKENLKLALQLEKKMNELYPTLAKPVELSQYRYNMQATTGSILVEIGCTGNTLDESLAAARFFADATSRVLLGLTAKS